MSHHVLWELQRHTGAKHQILGNYLVAWFPILGSAHARVIFVDGFAGPGEYARGERGSPLVALDAARMHRDRLSDRELMFLFVEEDRERHQHLEGVIAAKQAAGEIPENFHYVARHGTFADEAESLLRSLHRNPSAPTFVMIDPFGVKGVPYQVICELAAYPRTEFLISFMYESVDRFMSTDQFEPHLDALFGTQEWRRALEVENTAERSAYLHDLFVRQIRAAGLEYARSFRMIDDGGRTEYFLVFATHSLKGLEVMKNAMWSVDPSGTYRFSDTTNPDQMVLFQLEPDFEQLRSSITRRFAGQTVSIQAIEDFVVAETPFLKRHLRKSALAGC